MGEKALFFRAAEQRHSLTSALQHLDLQREGASHCCGNELSDSTLGGETEAAQEESGFQLALWASSRALRSEPGYCVLDNIPACRTASSPGPACGLGFSSRLCRKGSQLGAQGTTDPSPNTAE
jgi:hypothetical protein